MASDVMCIPYREILTSGTTMLSLSFGKPVISINRGFLRDVITESTGILVEPGDDHDLAKALCSVRKKRWNSEAIITHANCYTFDQAATIFISEMP
jgi:glycosyltransferase involved in cell wall biosynthesis